MTIDTKRCLGNKIVETVPTSIKAGIENKRFLTSAKKKCNPFDFQRKCSYIPRAQCTRVFTLPININEHYFTDKISYLTARAFEIFFFNKPARYFIKS